MRHDSRQVSIRLTRTHLHPAAVEEHADRDDHDEEHDDGGGGGADERREGVVVRGGDGVPSLDVRNRSILCFSNLQRDVDIIDVTNRTVPFFYRI